MKKQTLSTTKLYYIIAFSVFFILSTLCFTFILFSKEKFFSVFIAYSVLTLGMLLFSIILWGYIKQTNRNKFIIQRDDFLVSIQVIESLIVIIEEAHKALKKTITILGSEKRITNYNKINNRMDEMNKTLSLIKEKEINLKNDDISKNNVELMDDIYEDLRYLYGFLYSVTTSFTQNMYDFNNEIEFLKNSNDIIQGNLSRILFNLKTSIPILSELSKTSDNFSLDIIKKVFDEFDKMSHFTDDIIENTQVTINSCMDSEDPNSLAFIAKQATEVTKSFDSFFETMSNLKQSSNDFINNSVNSLKQIENTASAIEEIAEKIKIISINVRIEASHLGNINSGFQVLGHNVSEFATMTSKFAKDSHKRINETLASIENLKVQYINSMDNVFKYMEDMQSKIVPFEGIIDNSLKKIRPIIETLSELSKNIGGKIKGVIGNLQYHDVTSQEATHIILYLKSMTEVFNYGIKDININDIISEEEKKEIQTFVINNFRKFLTTENERKSIEKFEKMYDIAGAVIEDEDKLKGSKEICEGTILF
jgi:methyl-accepting chemotaxis protein